MRFTGTSTHELLPRTKPQNSTGEPSKIQPAPQPQVPTISRPVYQETKIIKFSDDPAVNDAIIYDEDLNSLQADFLR